MSLVRSLSGLLLFTLGLATGLNAQMITDASQRIEQKRTDLAGAPGMEVIASIVEFKPGESGGSVISWTDASFFHAQPFGTAVA